MIQNYELQLFISYFKNYIVIHGRADSSFNIVKPVEYKSQLFHIKLVGKTLTCTSIPVFISSLNTSDVFVLDLGLNIYQ